MKRKCPSGKYYCYTDKKCKKIPKGFKVVGRMGYLRRENGFSKDENETKKNGNGSSNGNGNGGNGAGNGNGGSGGGANGNGGGMGEEVIYEILDKKDVPHVRKLVKKLRAGSKTHAKQADDLEVAMKEESNPRVPRKKGQPAKSKKHSDLYTDEDPKGTIHGLGFKDVAKAKTSVSKIRNSSRSHAHKIQAAVAMEQRAREMGKTSEAAVYRKYINSMKKKTKKMNEGMHNHPEFALITVAVDELEKGLMDLEGITYDSVDKLMQGIAKRNNITPTLLHNQFKSKHLAIPDDWAIKQRMNKARGIGEATMTPAQKRKDTMLKKKYDKSDMKKSMQKQYGKEEGKKVYFATIRKQAMGEMAINPLRGRPEGEAAKRYKRDKPKRKISPAEQKIFDRQKDTAGSGRFNNTTGKPRSTFDRSGLDTSRLTKDLKPKQGEVIDDDYKYNVSEEGLRDWFGKSSGTTKSGRKVKGWVQVGGKYDGKPCARQPGQKSTPKCVSSSKRRSMSDKERDSAARRKRAADPNQPQKSGAAKPTNVSTDPKKKMSENYFNEKKMVKVKLNPEKKIGVKVADIGPGGKEVVRKDTMNEAKDKKGKGSGTKDACYHKVKSRYSVWPSAYASGALVKCRKVGAANWGNKSKNEGFSPMQVAALEAAGMIEIKEGKKCWKGYKKAGTQKLFGKTYNRCVKAGDELNHDGQQLQEVDLPNIPKKPVKMVQGKREGVLPPDQSKIKNKKALPPSDKPKTEPELPKLESYAPVTEGVMALMKKKEEKKKSKPSVSTYVSKSKSDAGNRAAKIMRDKEQRKYVGFLPANEEKDLTNESKTRLVKNGHTYKVILTWRGKTYMVQMFVPSVSRPTREQIEKEVQKLYPDAKVMSFLPKDLEPGEPTVMMGEGKNLEFMKQYRQKEKEQKMKKEIKKNLQTYEGDEQHNTRMGEAIEPEGMKLRDVERIKRQKQLSDAAKKAPEVKNKIVPIKTEEVIHEDDMKGMSVSSGHKRPTKSGAGMTAKGVAAYRRRNPGSKLQTAVTGKVKKGSKDAKRRKSYCARSAGQMKKFPKAAKDPNSRLRQARRRWKC